MNRLCQHLVFFEAGDFGGGAVVEGGPVFLPVGPPGRGGGGGGPWGGGGGARGFAPGGAAPPRGERALPSPKSRSGTARRSAHPIQIRGFASMMHRDQEPCTNAPSPPLCLAGGGVVAWIQACESTNSVGGRILMTNTCPDLLNRADGGEMTSKLGARACVVAGGPAIGWSGLGGGVRRECRNQIGLPLFV